MWGWCFGQSNYLADLVLRNKNDDGTLLAVGTRDGGLIFDVERLLNSDFT